MTNFFSKIFCVFAMGACVASGHSSEVPAVYKDVRRLIVLSLAPLEPEFNTTLKSLRATSTSWKTDIDSLFPTLFHQTVVTPKNREKFLGLLKLYSKKKRAKRPSLPPIFTSITFTGFKLTKRILSGLEIFKSQRLTITDCSLSKNFIAGLRRLDDVTCLDLLNSRLSKSLWQPRDFELPHNLRCLSINGVEIPRKQALRIYNLASLEQLHLSRNIIESGVKISLLGNLREINLNSNNIKGPALRSLTNFAQLESLSVDHNPGLKADDLMEIQHLSLRKLSLKDTQIASEDVPKIIAHFSGLSEIHLGYMRLKLGDLEQARRENPQIEIYTDFCRVE